MKNKQTIQAIDCPILMTALERCRKACKYSRTKQKPTFSKVEIEGLVFPEGIVGAIVIEDEDMEQYQAMIRGEYNQWDGVRYTETKTLDTPSHGPVEVSMMWTPESPDDDPADMDKGWVKSDRCKYIGGWVKVKASTEGFLPNLEMDPSCPPTTVQEGLQWVKKVHWGLKVLNDQGRATGEIPPSDVIPPKSGKHLIHSANRWWIVEMKKCGGPPSR